MGYLDDAEFQGCLRRVNTRFREHHSLLHIVALEPVHGPQRLDDRCVTEKVDYIEDPRVYKYHDERGVHCELCAIDDSLESETAPKLHFETA